MKKGGSNPRTPPPHQPFWILQCDPYQKEEKQNNFVFRSQFGWTSILQFMSKKIKTSKNEGCFDLVEGKVNYHSTMEFENMK